MGANVNNSHLCESVRRPSGNNPSDWLASEKLLMPTSRIRSGDALMYLNVFVYPNAYISMQIVVAPLNKQRSITATQTGLAINQHGPFF